MLELVERARQGDGGAFEALASCSRVQLEAFIARRIRPELRGQLDAGELAGETLARAFESLARFSGECDDA